MSSYPTGSECIDILKKSGCSKDVINHSIAVKDLACRIAQKTDADINLVRAGALLHDIGRCKTHDIKHVLEGVKIAKKLDLSKKLVKIIERHIGAGLNREDAKKLGLPYKDFIPISLEEKIVCHADNLIKYDKKQTIEDAVEYALSKGFKDYAVRLIKLHQELCKVCGTDLNKI